MQFYQNSSKKTVFLAIFVVFAVTVGALLSSGSSIAEKVTEMMGMQHDKMLEIQKLTTQSGIEIWMVKDETLPIISLDFAFEGAGSINDPDSKQGLAQLLSNTMDEGAGPYTSTQFQKLLTDNSIDLNFRQSRDHFSGHLKTLTRHKDLAFELLKLSLTQARFEQEAVDRMRDANLTRIKSALSNPNWIAARIMNDRIYPDHPYARNSGGTLSSLPSITPDDLRAFVKTHLGKDRLKIGIVGNLDTAQVKELVEQTFSELPATSTTKISKDNQFGSDREISLYQKDIPQTIVRVIWDGVAQDDPDYYSAMIMNYIFGGSGFGSRLMIEVREKRGLSYGIYSSLAHQQHANLLTVQTSTNNDSVEKLLSIIEQERKKIISEKVSEEELNAAKSYLTGSLPLSLTSTSNISGLLLGLQLDDLPIDYLDKRNEYINAVSAEDIKLVAKRLFANDNSKTVLVGQPEKIKANVIIEDLPNVK